MADVGTVDVNVDALTQPAIKAVTAGVAAVNSVSDAGADRLIKFCSAPAATDMATKAPDAFMLIVTRLADQIPAGGEIGVDTDQLTDVQQTSANSVSITAATGTGLVVSAGFTFSNAVSGAAHAANRFQFSIKVTLGKAFTDNASTLLQNSSMAQQLNTLSKMMGAQ